MGAEVVGGDVLPDAATNGDPSSTVVPQRPAVNADLERQKQRRIETVKAAITKVNQTLELNPDGKGINDAGTRALNSLGYALNNLPGRTAELDSSVLTKGLSDPNNPDLQSVARKTLESALDGVNGNLNNGSKIILPQPSSGEKPQERQRLENRLVLNDNGKGGGSTLAVMHSTQAGQQNYDVFYTAQQSGSSPAVSIFTNTKEPGVAYVVVSRRSSDGKIESTEVATVSSSDVLGKKDNRPVSLAAKIFSKSGEKTDNMNLSGLDLEAMQLALEAKLKKPAPAEPTPAASAVGDRGAGAPRRAEQPADPTSGHGGQLKGGAGGGGSTPPTGGTQGPGSQPERPLKILPDGRFDKAEWLAMLGMLKADGAVRLLNQEYPGKVKSNEDGKLVVEVEPGKYVAIAWTTGETTRKGNPSDEAVTRFENVASRILKGSIPLADDEPRSLPGSSAFKLTGSFSPAESKALQIALQDGEAERSFVKILAGKLGLWVRQDKGNTIQLSNPNGGSRLSGVEKIIFDKGTGKVQFSLGKPKPGPLSFLDGLSFSDRHAINPTTPAANNIALKRAIIETLEELK